MLEMLSCILAAQESSPCFSGDANPSFFNWELDDAVAKRAAFRLISWDRRVELQAANWLEFLVWEIGNAESSSG